MISLASFVVFFVFPVHAPKPLVADPRGMDWLLQLYDAPYNSLPSLHAALLVYTIAIGRRVVGDAAPRGLWSAVIVWAGLILYATIATREHYAIDIVAGAALALVVHAWIWRDAECGEAQEPQEQRPDVPRRVEVMVGPEHGIDAARQVERIGQ